MTEPWYPHDVAAALKKIQEAVPDVHYFHSDFRRSLEVWVPVAPPAMPQPIWVFRCDRSGSGGDGYRADVDTVIRELKGK